MAVGTALVAFAPYKLRSYVVPYYESSSQSLLEYRSESTAFTKQVLTCSYVFLIVEHFSTDFFVFLVKNYLTFSVTLKIKNFLNI